MRPNQVYWRASMGARWPIPVLMYHRIGPPVRGSIVASHYVTPRRLGHHLRLLRRLKFAPMACSELARSLSSGNLPEDRRVAITFDDGYACVHDVALPLLERHAFTACVFVVTCEIGGVNRWDLERGDVAERLMTCDQLRTWVSSGHEVGSHTRRHQDLSAAPAELAREEIEGSRTDLAALLGQAPLLFCYPYGRHSAETPQVVRESGYEGAFTTRSKGVTSYSDPFLLPRVNVRADTTAMILLYKLVRTRFRG